MVILRTLIGTGNGWLISIVVALVAFVSWTYTQRALGRAQGAASVVSQINTQTDKLNAKARKARSAARAPGSVERVRQNYCRDC
jgi:hypothetical protein